MPLCFFFCVFKEFLLCNRLFLVFTIFLQYDLFLLPSYHFLHYTVISVIIRVSEEPQEAITKALSELLGNASFLVNYVLKFLNLIFSFDSVCFSLFQIVSDAYLRQSVVLFLLVLNHC